MSQQSPAAHGASDLTRDESWPLRCPLQDHARHGIQGEPPDAQDAQGTQNHGQDHGQDHSQNHSQNHSQDHSQDDGRVDPCAGSSMDAVDESGLPASARRMTILRRPSDARVKGLTCPVGHRFDAAKQGYVNLLVGRGSSATPDSAAMIMARERVQDAGVFDMLTTTLDQLAARWTADHKGVILDCGAGTGHHLRKVLEKLPEARGVAVDLSPAGLRRAARDPRVLALAWDLWRPLPVVDGAAALLLDVFAPRNVEEYFRVLSPGASAIVVTPRAGHLRELSGLGLLGMQPDKLADLTTQMRRRFPDTVEHRVVTAQVPVEAAIARDMVMMGPAGHHRESPEVSARIAEADSREVTIDLDVTVWRRRPVDP